MIRVFFSVSVDRRPVDLFQIVFPPGVVVTQSRQAKTSFPVNVDGLVVVLLERHFTISFLLTLDVLKMAVLSSLTVDGEALLRVTKHCLGLI